MTAEKRAKTVKPTLFPWLLVGAGVLATLIILLWGSTRSPLAAYDDAYITYRYADNLRQGWGLVYNRGEWVLGTTTPLFALLLGAVGVIAQDLEVLGHWLGILGWIGAAWAALWLFMQVGRPLAAIVAPLLVATQPTLLASVGMETPLLVALMLSTAAAWLDGRKGVAVVLAALLFLTRYDAALWLLLLGLAIWRRERVLPWREGLSTVALALPWLVFALWRYGSFLPNSISAKIGQTDLMPVGELPSFWQGLLEEMLAALPPFIFPIVLLVLLIGIWVAWRERTFWWLPAWLLLYTAIYTVLGVVTFPWYYVPPLTAVALLVALGSGELLGDGQILGSERRRFPRLAVQGGTLLVLLGLLVWRQPALQEVAERPYSYRPAYRDAGAWLAANSERPAAVATIEIGVLGYLSRRPVVDTMGLVSEEMTTHQVGWAETLVYALNAYRPDYAIVLPDTAWDEVIDEWWFQEQYAPEVTFGQVTIYGRREGSGVAGDTTYQVPLQVELANGLLITGVTFPDQELEPGATLDAWIEVAVTASQEEDYTLTVYLQDSQTYEVQEVTKEVPFSGLYGSKRWQPGDHLRIPVRLAVPAELAPGTYRLGVSFFDPSRDGGVPLAAQPDVLSPELLAGWLRVGLPAQPRPAYPLFEQAVTAQWENGIALTGMDLPEEATPAGASLPLQLHWQTAQPVLRDLTVFVHLLDENGEIVAQRDERPFGGRWPTTVWPAGQRFVDLMEVALPEDLPAGRYALRLGLYDANGRIPLVSNQGEYLLLADIVTVVSASGE